MTRKDYVLIAAQVRDGAIMSATETQIRLAQAVPDMAKMLNLWMCFVLHGSNSAYNEKEMLDQTRALLAKVQS